MDGFLVNSFLKVVNYQRSHHKTSCAEAQNSNNIDQPLQRTKLIDVQMCYNYLPTSCHHGQKTGRL